MGRGPENGLDLGMFGIPRPYEPRRSGTRTSLVGFSDLDQAVDAARGAFGGWAFGGWAATPLGERQAIVSAIGDRLADHTEESMARAEHDLGAQEGVGLGSTVLARRWPGRSTDRPRRAVG
jgi:acyl-CoA reductase-like NAD-dependent aldehyde dehydrogenase